MTSDKPPVTIKKYANRRLYNTGTSAYVTLEDLAAMVKHGEDFVVYDAKTGEDITRSVLTQIIFEQEGKGGQSLLPVTFLRQLIRFYGSSMQMLVPSYLEFSLDKLTNEKSDFAEQFSHAFSTQNAFTRPMFSQIEEQTRKNMAMFRQALSLFAPFTMQPPGMGASMGPGAGMGSGPEASPPDPVAPRPETKAAEDIAGVQSRQERQELDEMKRQLVELQQRIEGLSPKD